MSGSRLKCYSHREMYVFYKSSTFSVLYEGLQKIIPYKQCFVLSFIHIFKFT